MSARKLSGFMGSSSTKSSNGVTSNSLGTPRESVYEICVVEEILKKRVVHGRVYYLVKWLGDDNPQDNTWEEVSNLNCEDLIREFEEKHPETSDDEPNDLEESFTTEENSHKSAEGNVNSIRNSSPPKSNKENKTPKQQNSQKRHDFRDRGTSQKKTVKNKDELPKMVNGKRTYEVEDVVNKRVDVNGGTQYKIKWKGYKTQSWEPMENLLCQDLIDKFEQSLERAQSRSRSIPPTIGTTSTGNIYKPLRSRCSSVVSPQQEDTHEPTAKRARQLSNNTSSVALTNFITPKSNNAAKSKNVENGSATKVAARVSHERRAKSVLDSSSQNCSSVSMPIKSTSTKLSVSSSTKQQSSVTNSNTRNTTNSTDKAIQRTAQSDLEVLAVKRNPVSGKFPIARVRYSDSTEEYISTETLAENAPKKLIEFYESYLNLIP